jgi:copper resistance protein C
MRMRILVISLLLTAFANAAHAHAFLDHASPLVGSTVASAARGCVDLHAELGVGLQFRAGDRRQWRARRPGQPQISGSTMRIGLKSLPQGTYRVRWQALSVDTHKTEGSFTFRVGGP